MSRAILQMAEVARGLEDGRRPFSDVERDGRIAYALRGVRGRERGRLVARLAAEHGLTPEEVERAPSRVSGTPKGGRGPQRR